MINIKQFRYSEDNLAYVLYGTSEAISIDPGCPDIIFDYVNSNKLTLRYILNTHTHHDHSVGNDRLKELTGVNVCDSFDIKSLQIDNESIKILKTPGHTLDSVCFITDNFAVTGDTLFIANIGKCPESSLELYWKSICKLLLLPAYTLIYPGHDYTERSLNRATMVEPDNVDIPLFRKQYDFDSVQSTIAWEKKINPYLRAGTEGVKKYFKSKGMNIDTDFDCFKSAIKLLK